jgi:hypothetical protein
VAKDFYSGAKKVYDNTRDSIKQRELNFRNTIAGIEKTPEYPTDDKPYVFPKYWKELSELRKKQAGPQLTAKEIKLLKALNSVYKPDYDDKKFRDVIDHIQEKSGITLIIDEGSMRDAMVEYDDPVTFKTGTKVTVRTILKKVLGDKGLTYIIKEGMVQVMTPKKASEMLVTRSYPVADLVTPDMQAQMFGPFVARAQLLYNAQQLINLVQSTIEPDSWQPNGPNTITFWEPTRTLIVRAPTEMHYQLGSGMFGR